MRKILLAAAAALTLGVVASSGAQAAPLSSAGHLGAIETVGFMFDGNRYCWSWAGWHGPGWYHCGYSWRRGFGWGGPAGWHGWRHPESRAQVWHHRKGHSHRHWSRRGRR